MGHFNFAGESKRFDGQPVINRRAWTGRNENGGCSFRESKEEVSKRICKSPRESKGGWKSSCVVAV